MKSLNQIIFKKYMVDQFSQHHLLKRFFNPLYILASFVKDKVSICAWIYQRNANQNHYEVPFHASQNGCNPKVYKQ